MVRPVVQLLGSRSQEGGILPSVSAWGKVVASNPDVRMIFIMNDSFEGDIEGKVELIRVPRFVDEAKTYWELCTGALRLVMSKRVKELAVEGAVFHAHTRGGLIAGYLVALVLRAKVIVTHHAYANRPKLFMLGRYLKNVEYVYLTRHMKAYYGGATEEEVISECCDLRFFKSELREIRTCEVGKIRLVGLGAITPRKRWHVIAEAVALLSKSERDRLDIKIYGSVGAFGKGPAYNAKLTGMIEELGLGNTIHILDPTNDVTGVLEACDWYLFPSHMEPCSVALIEAVASGIPAIVANSGGSPEIVIEGVGGIVFEADDSTMLADVLQRILNGRAEMGRPEEIRDSARDRSPEEVGAAYLDYYERALVAGDE